MSAAITIVCPVSVDPETGIASKETESLLVNDRDYLKECKTFQTLIEDLPLVDTQEIPSENVDANTMKYYLEYCVQARDHPSSVNEFGPSGTANLEIKLTDWEEGFLAKLNADTESQQMRCLLASDFLGHFRMQKLMCYNVSRKIRGKTPAEIRAVFGIEPNLTPEEEANIRKEHAWCLDE